MGPVVGTPFHQTSLPDDPWPERKLQTVRFCTHTSFAL